MKTIQNIKVELDGEEWGIVSAISGRLETDKPTLKAETSFDEFAVERAWKSMIKHHVLGRPITRQLVAEALKAASGKKS
jgi:hypothetical protein